jgi:hypothetical protein
MFSVLMFSYNMQWKGSISVLLIWSSNGLLYLDGYLFLKIWKFFWYYFIEYVSYAFSLYLFSFLNAHDS